MLHQVGVSFDLYYDARKHKINICLFGLIIYVRKELITENIMKGKTTENINN